MPESAKEGARPLAESSDIGLGSRDRAFESPHSDQNPSEIVDFRGIFLILKKIIDMLATLFQNT